MGLVALPVWNYRGGSARCFGYFLLAKKIDAAAAPSYFATENSVALDNSGAGHSCGVDHTQVTASLPVTRKHWPDV